MNRVEYPNQAIVSAASNAPYLEREQEKELAVLWAKNRDQNALHQLTMAHTRLVIAWAVKYKHYGLSIADLIQEGHIGLLEAETRFEPERDIRFSTYAIWWIKASMQDFILKNWSIVRGGTSSNQKSLFFNLRKIRAKIERNGKPSNSQELYAQLAKALKVSPKAVAQMDARFTQPDFSLNASRQHQDETGDEHQEFLISTETSPDENVRTIIDSEREIKWLNQAKQSLDPRENLIIAKRRLSDKTATLEDLGNELGISKERVRQIEAKALEKLRTKLLSLNADFETYCKI